MEITPYHAQYFAYELTKKVASNSIEKLASALVDARVDFLKIKFLTLNAIPEN